MKKIMAFLICIGSLFPTVLYAHALSPTHYPLGPLPFIFLLRCEGFWSSMFILPIMLTVEFLILWKFIPTLGFWGNLWRSFVLYVAAHIFETGVFFIYYSLLNIGAGWNELFGSLTACLLINFISKALIGLLLYKRKTVGFARLFLILAGTTICSYLTVYIFLIIFRF